MSTETVRLHDVYETRSLTTRATAKDLTRRVRSSPSDIVVLDFAMIDSATRSFMDQFFHEYTHEIRPYKRVKFRNVNRELRSAWFYFLRHRIPAKRAEVVESHIEIVNI